MESVSKCIKKYEKIAAELTGIFPGVREQKNAGNFFIAYTYFMKELYELKYLFDISVFKKEKQYPVDFEHMKATIIKIDKCIESLKLTAKSVGLEIKGASESMEFYTNHKSQFKKWTIKTPREKIIKSLELWTGQRGEKAVIKSLTLMTSNVNHLFDYIMEINNINVVSNKMLSLDINSLIMNIYKYYLKHRRYIGYTSEKRNMNTSDKSTKISHKDNYLNINIKLKNCYFNNMASNIEVLLRAVSKVDHEFVLNTVKQFLLEPVEIPEQEHQDPGIRINLMKKIIQSANRIQEDLKCNPEKMQAEINSGDLMKLVQQFVELEEQASEIADNISMEYKAQQSNFEILKTVAEELIGPSTVPCVRHVARFLVCVFSEAYYNKSNLKNRYNLQYTEILNKKKITKQGEALIALFTSL